MYINDGSTVNLLGSGMPGRPSINTPFCNMVGTTLNDLVGPATFLNITNLTQDGYWNLYSSNAPVFVTGSVASTGNINLGTGTFGGPVLNVTGNFSHSGGNFAFTGGSVLVDSGPNPVSLGGTTTTAPGSAIFAPSVTVAPASTLTIGSGGSPVTGPTVGFAVFGGRSNSGGTIAFTTPGLTLTVSGGFSEFLGTLSMQASFVTGLTNVISVGGSAYVSGNLFLQIIGTPPPGSQVTLITTGANQTGSGSFSSLTSNVTPQSYGWLFIPATNSYNFVVNF